MSRHASFSWYDSSQVFSDTQRVDLFNDPAWETTLPTATSTRAGSPKGAGTSWWVVVKGVVTGRALVKQGQHSHKLA
jgi:hypothetical protein